MSKRKLTPKQEKFCQLYVNGATKADAYRGAYSTENQANNTIQRNAHALSTRNHVLARIEQLRKELAQKNKYTLEKSVKRDLNLIKTYESALEILQNIHSTKQEILTADRTIKYIGATGYSQAQDRLSKQLGFYEKDNKQKEVKLNVISLGRGVKPE